MGTNASRFSGLDLDNSDLGDDDDKPKSRNEQTAPQAVAWRYKKNNTYSQQLNVGGGAWNIVEQPTENSDLSLSRRTAQTNKVIRHSRVSFRRASSATTPSPLSSTFSIDESSNRSSISSASDSGEQEENIKKRRRPPSLKPLTCIQPVQANLAQGNSGDNRNWDKQAVKRKWAARRARSLSEQLQDHPLSNAVEWESFTDKIRSHHIGNYHQGSLPQARSPSKRTTSLDLIQFPHSRDRFSQDRLNEVNEYRWLLLHSKDKDGHRVGPLSAKAIDDPEEVRKSRRLGPSRLSTVVNEEDVDDSLTSARLQMLQAKIIERRVGKYPKRRAWRSDPLYRIQQYASYDTFERLREIWLDTTLLSFIPSRIKPGSRRHSTGQVINELPNWWDDDWFDGLSRRMAIETGGAPVNIGPGHPDSGTKFHIPNYLLDDEPSIDAIENVDPHAIPKKSLFSILKRPSVSGIGDPPKATPMERGGLSRYPVKSTPTSDLEMLPSTTYRHIHVNRFPDDVYSAHHDVPETSDQGWMRFERLRGRVAHSASHQNHGRPQRPHQSLKSVSKDDETTTHGYIRVILDPTQHVNLDRWSSSQLQRNMETGQEQHYPEMMALDEEDYDPVSPELSVFDSDSSSDIEECEIEQREIEEIQSKEGQIEEVNMLDPRDVEANELMDSITFSPSHEIYALAELKSYDRKYSDATTEYKRAHDKGKGKSHHKGKGKSHDKGKGKAVEWEKNWI